jgi:4-carboxymuconolactone decarboxylase
MNRRWTADPVTYEERLPPLADAALTPEQRAAADALTRGPRGGVKGPFIPLLRSPPLVERMGALGEYVRFQSALPGRISEFVMLYVAREWSNAFEWQVHAPLAVREGVTAESIAALAEGRRPHAMPGDEDAAYALCDELTRTRGVCDATYARALAAFGERGVVDLVAVYGYFAAVCALMNVAHTPPGAPAASDAPLATPALPPLPR